MKSSAKCSTSDGPSRATRGIVVLAAGAGLAAGAAVLFFFDPARSGFYPQCLLHQYTGLNCPACGSLRALHHLTHGEFRAAFHCNPLLIVLLLLAAWIGGDWLVRGRAALEKNPFLRPGAAYILLFMTVVFTVLRNLPGPVFAWMSP